MKKTIKKYAVKTGTILFVSIVLFCCLTIISGSAQTDQNKIAVGKALTVSFIDVGQADCILIHTSTNQNMLIDAGNSEDFPAIRSFLQSQKVARLDIVVATHPHEDHIGSLEQVIRNFEIGKIYMPKVSTNTKTFEDLLTTIKAKGLKISTAKAGINFELTPGVTSKFLAPNSDFYENLNDYSAVIKLTYHKVAFVFTGDAGKASELEMINSNIDLGANILKVGHHGSSSSNTAVFLQRVAPAIAVISVGAHNVYHHPSELALKRLVKFGVKIYRTDQDGTISIVTDGKKVVVNCNLK